MISFLRDFYAFIRVRKKFWLVPVLLAMLLFGGVLIAAKGSVIAPFIYTVF